MNTAQIIDLSFYGVAAFFIIIGALLGLVRGVKRQSLRLVSVIASAVLAYVACKLVSPYVISGVGQLQIEQIISMAGLPQELVNIISGIDAETLTCILALPISLIVMPLLTIPVFYLLVGIFELIHKVVCGIFGFTRKNNNLLTRIIGAVVGAAEGIILALVIIVPAAGVLSVASGAIADVNEKHPESANTKALTAMYDSYLGGVEGNAIVKLTDTAFSGVYGMFTTVNVSGVDVKTPEAINTVACVFVKYGDLTGTNWVELSDESKANMNEIKDYLNNDPYCTMVISGVLRVAGGLKESGLIPLELEPPFDSVLNSIFDVFSTSTKDNLHYDLDTVLGIYYLLSDEGVLREAANGGDVMNALMQLDEEGVSVFSRANELLSENERMSVVVNELVKVAVNLLLEQSGLDGDAVQTISNIKDGLTSALAIERSDYATEEEYEAAVSDSIGATLAENGIGLEESELEAVTDYVINEMGGIENVTDADIAEFMAKYYDVYSGE